MVTISSPHIMVEKVSNGYIVQWLVPNPTSMPSFLLIDDKGQSQHTKQVTMIASDDLDLFNTIKMALKDTATLVEGA